MNEQEPCIPITLLLAICAELERARDELRAYRGDPDVRAEMVRLGLADAGAGPSTARVLAAVARLGRVSPGGIAPREGVARFAFGASGPAELHAVRVQMTRVRRLLATVGRGMGNVPALGWRLTDTPNATPYRGREATCMECGKPSQHQSLRCRPCHQAHVKANPAPPPPCISCGGPCSARGRTCLACYLAAGRERARLALVCPDCGGRKAATSARCRPCAVRAMPRHGPGACLDCGAAISHDARRCVGCHMALARAARHRLARAWGRASAVRAS